MCITVEASGRHNIRKASAEGFHGRQPEGTPGRQISLTSFTFVIKALDETVYLALVTIAVAVAVAVAAAAAAATPIA